MWAQALGRAPTGSVPARAARGEAAAAASQIQLGCDIEKSAAHLLQLLFEVGAPRRQQFLDGMHGKTAACA